MADLDPRRPDDTEEEAPQGLPPHLVEEMVTASRTLNVLISTRAGAKATRKEARRFQMSLFPVMERLAQGRGTEEELDHWKTRTLELVARLEDPSLEGDGSPAKPPLPIAKPVSRAVEPSTRAKQTVEPSLGDGPSAPGEPRHTAGSVPPATTEPEAAASVGESRTSIGPDEGSQAPADDPTDAPPSTGATLTEPPPDDGADDDFYGTIRLGVLPRFHIRLLHCATVEPSLSVLDPDMPVISGRLQGWLDWLMERIPEELLADDDTRGEEQDNREDLELIWKKPPRGPKVNYY